jgi:hypothetical protein
MKQRSIVAITLIAACITGTGFLLNRQRPKVAMVDPEKFASYVRGLDPTVFTKEYIDKTIKIGMSAAAVEAIVGKPYRESQLIGTQRASYRISDDRTGVLRLIGITIVYKDDKVVHVDEDWGTQ